ncbi:conserved hypothetical protein [Burkholderia vietnamiensis]
MQGEFEKVNRENPLDGLNRFPDHAETLSGRSMNRSAA